MTTVERPATTGPSAPPAPSAAGTPGTRGVMGASRLRKEDDRLLRGDGRFTDDVEPAHVLHMAVGRCPYPHARIVRVDTSAAEQLEGVKHVLVGADVRAGTEPLGVLRPVPRS